MKDSFRRLLLFVSDMVVSSYKAVNLPIYRSLDKRAYEHPLNDINNVDVYMKMEDDEAK